MMIWSGELLVISSFNKLIWISNFCKFKKTLELKLDVIVLALLVEQVYFDQKEHTAGVFIS